MSTADQTSTATTTSDTTPAPVKVTPAKTCGAYVKQHASDAKFADRIAGRDMTCKRLPMHKGDCRPTLKAPVVKADRPVKVGDASPKGRVKRTAAQIKRDQKRVIATLLDAGVLTADQALAAASALA
jgi:hypothetical protein